MTIEQMKMILYVAETSSVNQAAKRLFISQPALSKSIQAAERELGQTLFERSKTGMKVTEYGRIFCGMAKSVVESYENVRSLSVGQMQWEYPVLRVSSCRLRFVAKVFSDIFRKYALSAAEMRYSSTNCSGVVQDVAEGLSDVGLVDILAHRRDEVEAELEKMGLTYTPLQEYYPVINVHYDSPLAKRPENFLTLDDLKGLKLFTIYEDLPIFEQKEQEIVSLLGLEPNQYTVYSDARAAVAAITPPGEFRCNLEAKGVYRRLGEMEWYVDGMRNFGLRPVPFVYEVGIVQSADAQYNALINEFLDRLGETSDADQTIRENNAI